MCREFRIKAKLNEMMMKGQLLKGLSLPLIGGLILCCMLVAGLRLFRQPTRGVRFDNTVRSGFHGGATVANTPALTIGTRNKRAAMIMVAMQKNNATDITASLGGVAGTLVPGTDTGTAASMRTMIFCVTNPPSGSQTATVSWTNSLNADVGVITVSGVDQTTPCTNGTMSANNAERTSTASVTVISDTGDLTVTVAATGGTWVSPYTNQILRWGVDSKEVGGDIGRGTGTTTHTWMDRWPSQPHAVSGANFKAPTP